MRNMLKVGNCFSRKRLNVEGDLVANGNLDTKQDHKN